MQIRCSGCQKVLRVNAQDKPIRVKCPGCGAVLQVPVAVAPEPPVNAPVNAPFDDPFGSLPAGPELTPQPFAGQSFQPAGAPTGAQTFAVNAAVGNNAANASKRTFPIWGYIAIAAAVLLIAPMICCGAIGLFGVSRMKGKPAIVMTEGLRAIPVPPTFPDLGQPVEQFPSGAAVYRVSIGTGTSVPGATMQLRVYIPAGEHQDRSVPCVLVAPAGTPLIHGADVEGDDYHDETLPYCESGMVVVHYSIDGAIPSSVDQNNDEVYGNAMAAAYPAFQQSGGGIVNGRNALEYALNKIPMVDPTRICAAGHSSAGTLALMLAAGEPRITHCAAYAPAYDVESRMVDATTDPLMRLMFPGLKEFITWYSPMNHTAEIQCKLMVFQSSDDDNVPIEDAIRYVEKVKSSGQPVHYVQVDQGGHYQSMIDQGIPAAIQWLGE